jgi:predicted DNA-binding protein (MmcQ/YjbR family)
MVSASKKTPPKKKAPAPKVPAETGPSRRTAALMAWIESKPGAEANPMSAPRASSPNVLIYKVMGKMFAILSIRGIENVILKCDPNLAQALREQYAGVGHRSHLDRRFWISVNLDADVPPDEVERLVGHSYELVCSGLTRKQKAELAARSA